MKMETKPRKVWQPDEDDEGAGGRSSDLMRKTGRQGGLVT
jgi:hypothetical protein